NTIAIVGYTNAGKSTLLNALTDSRVIVQDKLFSTLDPTIRRFILPNNQKVLFVDTVGFLNDLPHHLIEAFKATLEEVVNADLLLHVVDISHPKAKEQSHAVYKVLEEIGAGDVASVIVLNKIDKVAEKSAIDRAKVYFNDALAVSAVKREGFDALIDRILRHMSGFVALARLKIPIADPGLINLIYENGVVRKKEYSNESVYIEAELPLRIKDMLEDYRVK
ncbi:MAG: GTPase, partial [Candidatus Omnitrophota bacterium]|nr:GTPase [Candidatus Omnitrophota bacterium]